MCNDDEWRCWEQYMWNIDFNYTWDMSEAFVENPNYFLNPDHLYIKGARMVTNLLLEKNKVIEK